MADFGEVIREDLDSEVDPAAAFLAREQSDLAGLELELEGEDQKVVVAVSNDGGDRSVDYSISSFEVIGASEAGAGGGVSPTPLADSPGIGIEEQENIRKWREEQVKRLKIKDSEEEVKKQEWREVARKELEDWYRNHEDVIAKTKAQNRNAEKQFVAEEGEITPGSEWERIARLCDFNPKVKGSVTSSGAGAVGGASGGHSNLASHSPRDRDVSRMRTIILQRKQAQSTAA